MGLTFTGNDHGTEGEKWFSGSSRFEWNFTADEIASRKGFGRKFNKAIADILIQYYRPFVPYKGGNLDAYVQGFGSAKGCTVTYQMPYASRQYFLGSESGGIYTYPTNTGRTTTHHEWASSYWDKVAWTMAGDQIMRDVNEKRLEYAHE